MSIAAIAANSINTMPSHGIYYESCESRRDNRSDHTCETVYSHYEAVSFGRINAEKENLYERQHYAIAAGLQNSAREQHNEVKRNAGY